MKQVLSCVDVFLVEKISLKCLILVNNLHVKAMNHDLLLTMVSHRQAAFIIYGE